MKKKRDTTKKTKTKYKTKSMKLYNISIFIADACTIVVIYYVERTLVNCYNLCLIQLL
jgi:hypothetical protein